jgi:hypothetical protein
VEESSAERSALRRWTRPLRLARIAGRQTSILAFLHATVESSHPSSSIVRVAACGLRPAFGLIVNEFSISRRACFLCRSKDSKGCGWSSG